MGEAGPVNERDALALKSTHVKVERDAEARSWRIQADNHSLIGWAPSLGGGTDSGFRASDLLLAALGLCVTDMTMAYCRTKGFPVRRIVTELEDHAALDPLRVDAIRVVMHLEGDLTDEQKDRIHRVAAKHCKIKNTLAANPKVDVVIRNHATPGPAGDDVLPSDIKCAC